jgi:hypothetical protein
MLLSCEGAYLSSFRNLSLSLVLACVGNHPVQRYFFPAQMIRVPTHYPIYDHDEAPSDWKSTTVIALWMVFSDSDWLSLLPW